MKNLRSLFYLAALAITPLLVQSSLHADDQQQAPAVKEKKQAPTATKEDSNAGGTVEYISTNDFDSFTASGVVIVDFYADWCGPCKKLKPIFSQLAQSYKGKAKFAKVNIDHSGSVAKRFNVKRIPTVILFKDGKEVKRHGPGTKQDFIYWIDGAL